MKKLLKTALLSLTLSTGLTLSTLALAGSDEEFIAEVCGSDSACVEMMATSFALAAEESSALAAEYSAESSAITDGPGPAVSDMGATESPGETSAIIDGPGIAASEKAKYGTDGESGEESGVSGYAGIVVTYEEYDAMTDLEKEKHDEGRELTEAERADLGDFNATEDAVKEALGDGPIDPTELAKVLKAAGKDFGIDIKVSYSKEVSGLGCFGMSSATGKIGPISCSDTPESLENCSGDMASNYKSGVMKCDGFIAVGTKIK
jgi:hypothetical protein